MTIENLDLGLEFTDLAWEDEVYDEEEYPYTVEEDEDYDYFDLGSWFGDGEVE